MAGRGQLLGRQSAQPLLEGGPRALTSSLGSSPTRVETGARELVALNAALGPSPPSTGTG